MSPVSQPASSVRLADPRRQLPAGWSSGCDCQLSHLSHCTLWPLCVCGRHGSEQSRHQDRSLAAAAACARACMSLQCTALLHASGLVRSGVSQWAAGGMQVCVCAAAMHGCLDGRWHRAPETQTLPFPVRFCCCGRPVRRQSQWPAVNGDAMVGWWCWGSRGRSDAKQYRR